MSDTDSFIDEVSEEVRREKLYGHLKRYGWIAVLFVLALVGTAAFLEYQKAQAAAAAQATGDALVAALEVEDAAESAALLAQTETDETSDLVVRLLTAAKQEEAGDLAGAVATLEAVSSDMTVDREYRDLATFKALLLSADSAEPAARRAGFEAMAVPGQPYRLLAQEQLALMDVAEGQVEEALAGLAAIVEDAEVTRGLGLRSLQMIDALGGDVNALFVAE